MYDGLADVGHLHAILNEVKVLFVVHKCRCQGFVRPLLEEEVAVRINWPSRSISRRLPPRTCLQGKSTLPPSQCRPGSRSFLLRSSSPRTAPTIRLSSSSRHSCSGRVRSPPQEAPSSGPQCVPGSWLLRSRTLAAPVGPACPVRPRRRNPPSRSPREAVRRARPLGSTP